VIQSEDKSFNSVPNFQLMNFDHEKNQNIAFQTLETIVKNEESSFDRLISVGHIQSLDILTHSFPKLKSGAIIVLFSQFMEVLL